MNVDEIKKLKVARVKTQKSLMFYTRYFFKKRQNRKFVVNNHHEIIVSALEKVLKGEITRLIINIAPRYSKTELAVKNFISHCLANNPSAKFIHLSYSDDLALDNSEEIKDIIISDEYQQLYPEVQLKKDAKSKKKWYTTAGGGVFATSLSGQLTGFGAGKVDDEDLDEFFIKDKTTFGGAIIIDDPIKPDEAWSDIIRERVNNKFDSTIRNRVNSRNTPIIIIMQRLHEQDLCGYLIEKEPNTWHVISLPVIKEDGTALWEFKHNIEELKELRRVNEVVFDTQYMQYPKPLKGLIFPKESLNFYKELNNNEGVTLAYADPADEGEDSFSMAIARKLGNRWYLIDVIFSKLNLSQIEPEFLAKLEKYSVDCCFIETNSIGAPFVRECRNKTKVSIRGVKNTTNKLQRIYAQQGYIQDNIMFPEVLSDEYALFIKEVTSLLKSGSKHDDAPDCLAGLAHNIRTYYSDI